MANMKDTILCNLTYVRNTHVRNKEFFKIKAYDKVIESIKKIDEIKDEADLDKIEGCGKSIKEKLVTIIQTGTLFPDDDEFKDFCVTIYKNDLIQMFKDISGVGDVKALELVKQNMRSIEELRQNQHLLNDKQKLGLKYHEDITKRIPRKEMDAHNEFLKKHLPDDVSYVVTGSYRRGLATSGDIDVLITKDCDEAEAQRVFVAVVESLRKAKYLVDDLANGAKKYMGVCKLPRYKTFRRVDLMFTPKQEHPFALLYFTGSKEFNITVRNKAIELGYTINEHRMVHTKGASKGQAVANLESEKDILEHLGLEYVEPEKR